MKNRQRITTALLALRNEYIDKGGSSSPIKYATWLAERIEQFGLAIAQYYCWPLTGNEREKEIKKGFDTGIKALG